MQSLTKKNNRTCLLLNNENKIKKKRPGTAPFKKETRVKTEIWSAYLTDIYKLNR